MPHCPSLNNSILPLGYSLRRTQSTADPCLLATSLPDNSLFIAPITWWIVFSSYFCFELYLLGINDVDRKRIHWHLIKSKLKRGLCFVSVVNLSPIRAFGKFPMLRSFCNRIRQKQFFLNKPCCIEDKPPVHVCQVQLAGESDEERPSWNSVPLEWLAHLGVRCFAVYLYLYLFNCICLFVFVYVVCFWDLIPLKWLDHLRFHSFAHPLISKHL